MKAKNTTSSEQFQIIRTGGNDEPVIKESRNMTKTSK
jgi:hypothetical protein